MVEKVQDNETIVQEKEEVNSLVIKLPIKVPTEINEKKIDVLVLDFSNMTGADILSVDSEIRIEGNLAGFDSIYNQEVLLKLASRATGILPEELKKLKAPDFLEMNLQVRNFFILW